MKLKEIAKSFTGAPLKVMLVEELSSPTSILAETLVKEGFNEPLKIGAHDDIFRKASDAKAELLIVNVEEPDTKLLTQLKYINDVYPIPVIVFSKKGDSDSIHLAIQAGVSAFIVDGFAENRIQPVINVALARFSNLSKLREELLKTRENLANRKVIEKAKGLIMKQRQCTEDEAYRSLRKIAMDRNQKLSDVATSLVELSSLLIEDKTLDGIMPK